MDWTVPNSSASLSWAGRDLSTRARLLRVFILISTQNDAVLAIGSKAAQEVGMAFRALVRQAERAISGPIPRRRSTSSTASYTRPASTG